MSVLAVLGKLLPVVPRVVQSVARLIRDSTRRTLDAPLGESEAARAIRLEEERRTAAEAEKTRRGQS